MDDHNTGTTVQTQPQIHCANLLSSSRFPETGRGEGFNVFFPSPSFPRKIILFPQHDLPSSFVNAKCSVERFNLFMFSYIFFGASSISVQRGEGIFGVTAAAVKRY